MKRPELQAAVERYDSAIELLEQAGWRVLGRAFRALKHEGFTAARRGTLDPGSLALVLEQGTEEIERLLELPKM